ncbi:MAG: UDP-N-acetylmuramoyl-L-alanyl-D-glutamate--2,6-diaminopimelate ligase [Synechococcus sp.]
MVQTLHSLLHAVGLPTPESCPNPAIKALTCDSRCVGHGSLFLGLPGERVDGGSFWRQTLADGAAAAVIGAEAALADPPAPHDPVVVVSNPVADWAGALAAAFWQSPSRRMTLIGVTGTNGKTTTTHLIEHLCNQMGRSAALFGTLVNRWPGHSITATHTTAFADRLQAQLAEAVTGGAQVGAMEVSSHALNQGRVAGCQFSAAVFTNLTQDHLDYHPSMQAYFEAKARLFAEPLLMAEGARAVVNIDDPWGQKLADQLGERCWRCSLRPKSDSGDVELRMTDLTMTSSGVSGHVVTPVGRGAFQSPLIGEFNLMNLLEAVGVLVQQGMPLAPVLKAVACFKGVPGRMERVVLGSESVMASLPAVLVDYAHTPDGLRNALMAARPFLKGSLVCVFGCGGDRDRGKRPQMASMAAALADRVVVTSDNPRTEDPQQILDDVVAGIPAQTSLMVNVDRASAIAAAIAEAGVDDLVLIAGKGHEDYQILGTTKVHFDDREQAEIALRKRVSTAS